MKCNIKEYLFRTDIVNKASSAWMLDFMVQSNEPQNQRGNSSVFPIDSQQEKIMTNSISSVRTIPVAQSTVNPQKTTPTKENSNPESVVKSQPSTIVSISSTAKSAAAAEAAETPAQTAQEAKNGDHQAQMQVAKQAAKHGQIK